MSRLSDCVDEALAQRDKDGQHRIGLTAGGAEAEAEVVDSDRLGVRVGRLRVRKPERFDVQREAAALPDRLRSLPERLIQIEIDGKHGRAVLRTLPKEMRRREFFEVQIEGNRDLDLRRYRVDEQGDRQAIDWTMSREQFGRMLDELAVSTEDE
jgi:hypothetical protein